WRSVNRQGRHDMAWIWLGIAAIFEVAFALGTNATKGFTRLWPSVFTLAAAAGGIFTLSLALRKLDVGVGYTVWTGIGSIGTVVLGKFIFGEKLTRSRILCLAAIVAGVIGL